MCRSPSDALLCWALRAVAAVAGAIVLLMLLFLVLESLPALGRVGPGRFLTDPRWSPTEGLYNLVPMLVGSLLVTTGAMILATPLGILSAVFSNFYAPASVRFLFRRLMELLAGIPSVVYGFWGLVVLVPLIARIRPPGGPSLLAAMLILGLMILPTVALLADSSLGSVPREYLRGAVALGMTRWATVRRVALPAARSGLWTAVILATARALGETMAVLLVSGNVVRIPGSLFDSVRTLTANIALEMAYATGTHHSALFVSGLVLVGMIVVLIAAAEAVGGGRADG